MSMLAIIARGVSSRPWLAGLIAPAVLLGAGTFQRLLAGVRDASPARMACRLGGLGASGESRPLIIKPLMPDAFCFSVAAPLPPGR